MRAKKVLLVFVLLVSALSVAAYAVSVSVTTNTYQAQNGVYYVVTGNLQVSSQGFSVAQASAAASSQPCTWSNGGTCNTAITAGHWVYTVQVALTASTPPGTTFTVTVQWNTGTGYVTMGNLQFTTPTTITAGQTMNFVFDTGGPSFNAPAGIVITVG